MIGGKEYNYIETGIWRGTWGLVYGVAKYME